MGWEVNRARARGGFAMYRAGVSRHERGPMADSSGELERVHSVDGSAVRCSSLECRAGGWRIEVGFFNGRPLHLVRSGFVFVSLMLLSERSEVVSHDRDSPALRTLVSIEDVRVGGRSCFFTPKEMLIPLCEGESQVVELVASDASGRRGRYGFCLTRLPLGRVEFSVPPEPIKTKDVEVQEHRTQSRTGVEL